MDEALKEKLEDESRPTLAELFGYELFSPDDVSAKSSATKTLQPKEAPVATQSKYTQAKAWFKLHPKVKTAFVALAGVSFAAFDQAYNDNHDYLQAGKIAGAAAVVWVFAYLKSS